MNLNDLDWQLIETLHRPDSRLSVWLGGISTLSYAAIDIIQRTFYEKVSGRYITPSAHGLSTLVKYPREQSSTNDSIVRKICHLRDLYMYLHHFINNYNRINNIRPDVKIDAMHTQKRMDGQEKYILSSTEIGEWAIL